MAHRNRPPRDGRTRTLAAAPSETSHGVRVQRVLASAGLGSRRSCEQLILDGRVEIDGNVVTELGVRVDPNRQSIRVDGTNLKRPRLRYFALNKPVGVISTKRDPGGRTRVVDLIPDGHRYFTVGRLDRSSEGLILVTNDGELANRLAHPRYGVAKTYRVEVAGHPEPDAIRQWQKGIHLAEGMVRVSSIRVVKRLKQSVVLEMVLREGRNREIRRITARMGHKVLTLRRVAIGPLRLADLPIGAHRELTVAEVQLLREATRSGRPAPSTRPGTRTSVRRGAARPERRPRGPAGATPPRGRPAGGKTPRPHGAGAKTHARPGKDRRPKRPTRRD